ncbi:HNH endonuclease [Vibrio cholerae]|nr:HNH endonuclease [Vibrio cholerae]EJL6479669.1 HNH endonuclease [Vibrio cholerae]ELS9243387.1 HNH endonuclease [Vibrio cholerae]
MINNSNPKTICSYPACKVIATNKSRCQNHQHSIKTNDQRSSTTKNNDIYQSTKWRKLRARKATNNPLCEQCLKANIIKPLDVVDHIVEINDNPELVYVYSNLQSLCHAHHNAKTAQHKQQRAPKTLTASELFNKLRTR